jgi:phage gp29-like protein
MKGFPGILGPDGRAVSIERVQMEKQTRFNPLRNWTADVLVRQLEAFSRGEIASLAWVMEWLEKHDDTIATVAPKAKAAVSRHGFDVLPKTEIRPEWKTMAEDQKAFLDDFYQNLETSDAVELEEWGGMRLLVQQIMDAYGKMYGAHHIIWKPSRSGLSAELVKVPTWFFEVTTGRMRYLPSHAAQRGVDLSTLGGENAWMTVRGRGVMLAGVLARMFKQLPLQDWLTYCDRHGMPAFLGHTKAKKGSEEWLEMTHAVASIGSEYGAVVNTDDVIDVLDLKGSGELPYEKLVDRMDRAQVMLWRGGDLSTISRADGVGSNPQQEEADELDADNAAWVSETINRNLTNRAIAWKFGAKAPVLVELKLRTKTRDDLKQDLEMVKGAREFGVRISKSWFTGKFGIVEADSDEQALGESAPPTATGTSAINSRANADADIMSSIQAALREDLQPLGKAFAGALQAGDYPALIAAVRKISDEMPSFLQTPALEDALGKEFITALTEES